MTRPGRRPQSRPIVVDGVAYRYVVAPNDMVINLVVRREGPPGQVLSVGFSYRDEWVPTGVGSWSSAGHRLILPRVVRMAILLGLGRGWDPGASRPASFTILDGDDLLTDDDWPRTPRREPIPRDHEDTT